MRVFGLLGKTLGHSFSERYFREKFAGEGITDAQYRHFELPHIDMLPELMGGYTALRGLNVTLPYKCSIIPYLDRIDPLAREIGAVNCIVIRDGSLTGYNTDAPAFAASLDTLLRGDRPRALVLGTGGAAMAAGHVLEQIGIEYKLVSRSMDREDVLLSPGTDLSGEVLNNRISGRTEATPLHSHSDRSLTEKIPVLYRGPVNTGMGFPYDNIPGIPVCNIEPLPGPQPTDTESARINPAVGGSRNMDDIARHRKRIAPDREGIAQDREGIAQDRDGTNRAGPPVGTLFSSSYAGTIGYGSVREFISGHRLIVNATPTGMYPARDTAPAIPYDMLSPEHYLFDMVYNPAETLFMQLGKKYGARAEGGLEMFIRQAELSWSIWNRQ